MKTFKRARIKMFITIKVHTVFSSVNGTVLLMLKLSDMCVLAFHDSKADPCQK